MNRSALDASRAYGHTGYSIPEPGDPDAVTDKDGGWLISFVDILTLLVTLFVLLLAFNQTSGKSTIASTAKQSSATQAAKTQKKPPPESVRRQIANLSVPETLKDKLEIITTATTVNLIIKDDVLFDKASADLKPTGRAVLDHIAGILGNNSFKISVEGHTDNLPIHTARFPSNWELSTARATQVTRYLVDRGIASERLRATGYADTQPIANNSTKDGRARNRRVSLVVHINEPVTTI